MIHLSLSWEIGSSGGGVMVKLSACGGRGRGSSPVGHYNFRNWVSPASKGIKTEIMLKQCKILKTIQLNPTLIGDQHHDGCS